MSAYEQVQWVHHFNQYPPLEISLPLILANIGTLIAKGLGADKVSPSDFAPWLKAARKQNKPSEKPNIDGSYLQALGMQAVNKDA